jgi:hypothetical protein
VNTPCAELSWLSLGIGNVRLLLNRQTDREREREGGREREREGERERVCVCVRARARVCARVCMCVSHLLETQSQQNFKTHHPLQE